jgi:hypothetical protein
MINFCLLKPTQIYRKNHFKEGIVSLKMDIFQPKKMKKPNKIKVFRPKRLPETGITPKLKLILC